MGFIPISLVVAGLRAAELYGIPRSTLLGRPSVEERELNRPRGRVSWDAFCVFNERVEAAFRGRGGVRRYAELINPELPELRAVARWTLSAGQLVRLIVAVGNWAHPRIHTEVEAPAPDRLVLTLQIPDDMRDCPAFLRICGESMALTPRLIALPPARLVTTIAPRRAQYELALPPSRTLFRQSQDAASRVYGEMLERIVRLQEEVRGLLQHQQGTAAPVRTAQAAERWQLTPRQREVLELVVRGSSNKEIAARLGCAERTVELHVTTLLRKAGRLSRSELIASYWGEGS